MDALLQIYKLDIHKLILTLIFSKISNKLLVNIKYICYKLYYYKLVKISNPSNQEN